jgi:hypothetical protein
MMGSIHLVPLPSLVYPRRDGDGCLTRFFNIKWKCFCGTDDNQDHAVKSCERTRRGWFQSQPSVIGDTLMRAIELQSFKAPLASKGPSRTEVGK